MNLSGGIFFIVGLSFIAASAFAQTEKFSLHQYLEMDAAQQREIRDQISGGAIAAMSAELGPEFANCFKRKTTDTVNGDRSEWTREIDQTIQFLLKRQKLEQNSDEDFGDLMKRLLIGPMMQCHAEIGGGKR